MWSVSLFRNKMAVLIHAAKRLYLASLPVPSRVSPSEGVVAYHWTQFDIPPSDLEVLPEFTEELIQEKLWTGVQEHGRKSRQNIQIKEVTASCEYRGLAGSLAHSVTLSHTRFSHTHTHSGARSLFHSLTHSHIRFYHFHFSQTYTNSGAHSFINTRTRSLFITSVGPRLGARLL
jgi:hypothetical protein